MRISITTAVAIYFITWWLVLFLVLPFGVRSQHEERVTHGTDPGAPVAFRFGRTVLITTVLTAVLCGLAYAAFALELISF